MAVAGEIARLIVDLQLQDHGFAGKVNSIGQALGRMDTGLSRMGRGVGQVGSGLSRLATVGAAAAAGGLAAVVTTAASFEQAFTGVEKTVDGTEEQLKELEGTLRQMARTMPVSFEELSRIGEAGGALGVARESLDEFIDVVARLAVSTDLNADAAATALGQLGTVLHLEGAEFEQFADSLVALGNAGASTESQIVELAARFAAAGNSAGLSKEEILALASATASMGIEVEAGGTALSQTFNNIATGIGTGSDEIKAFTSLLGISAKEFKKRWTEDALGTFQDFLKELSKLDQFEQAAVLEEAGITGVRQLNAVKLMTQNLGFFGDQLEISRNATGALDKESQKFFDTTQGQWIILKNNVRDVANTIGVELLPVTNELIKEFVNEINKPGTQAGIRGFARDLAAGVKGLVTELKGTDFSGIIGGMKIAAEVAKGAFDAFRALPEPIQQLAIAALVANKVSGGAVGQIAKGLGNIFFGGLQGGLAGIFGGRGRTPLNPLFVSVTNPGFAGGVGGTGGRGGFGGFLAGFLGTAGIAGVTAGGVLAIEDITKGTKEGITQGTLAFTGGIGGLVSHAISQPIQDFLKSIFPEPPSTSTPLGQFDPRNRGGTPVPVKIVSGAGKTALSALERNAQDPHGLWMGADLPGGGAKAFERAFAKARLPDTAIAAIGQTARNTAALPPILSRAERTQDGWFSRLTNLASQQTMEQRNATSAARSTAQQVAAQRASTERGFANQAGYLNTIARKNFSPSVNVTARISNVVTVNANRVLNAVTEARVRTGTIPEFA